MQALKLDRIEDAASIGETLISIIWKLTEAPDAPSNLFLRKATCSLFPETFHRDLRDLLVAMLLSKVSSSNACQMKSFGTVELQVLFRERQCISSSSRVSSVLASCASPS